MKPRRPAAILAAALTATALIPPAGAIDAQQRRAAPAAADWTRTVVRTPEGGFRMGNPDAPVKVIEFLSFACPHCATFHAESGASLYRDHVRTGRVSIEYRNIVISAPDIAATVLARCAAPAAYFAMGHDLLRNQPQWLGRVNALTEAQRAQLRGVAPAVMAQRLAPMIGLDRIAARHGLTPAAQRACLSNQANYDRIEAHQDAAGHQYGVRGTPTFVINGNVVAPNSWAGIEPLLRGR